MFTHSSVSCTDKLTVLLSYFNKGISACWGREIPHGVLVSVWGAKKAECQRGTNSDTETNSRAEIGQGQKRDRQSEIEASEVLSDTEE